MRVPASLPSVALMLCVSAGGALAQPFAYVPNEGSGTLTVIDTRDDRVVAEIAAGSKPRGIAISRDGRIAYVSDQAANGLVPIDLQTRKAGAPIALGESPEGVSVSP